MEERGLGILCQVGWKGRWSGLLEVPTNHLETSARTLVSEPLSDIHMSYFLAIPPVHSVWIHWCRIIPILLALYDVHRVNLEILISFAGDLFYGART